MATLRPINEQMREFASCYVFDADTAGNGAASAVKAGYAEDSARQQAYKLLRHDGVRAEIDRLLREAIGDAAAVSVSMLRRILNDERDDAAMMRIKLDAAKTVLDRAGHIAPKATELPLDPASKPMSTWTLPRLEAFIEESKVKLAAMSAARAQDQGTGEPE